MLITPNLWVPVLHISLYVWQRKVLQLHRQSNFKPLLIFNVYSCGYWLSSLLKTDGQLIEIQICRAIIFLFKFGILVLLRAFACGFNFFRFSFLGYGTPQEDFGSKVWWSIAECITGNTQIARISLSTEHICSNSA